MCVAKAPTHEENALIRAAEMARLRSFAVEAELTVVTAVSF